MPLEFDQHGKLIRQRGQERRKLALPARRTIFEDGEKVRIVGLMPGRVFNGVIVSLSPLKARVTDKDKIWEGAETPSGIRKARQEQ